jgi:AraC-like DNA-binding protein
MLLILDEIRQLPVAPLHLPEPADGRLRSITTALRTDPTDDRTLDTWARAVGASTRTLARLFLAETGMTFRQWQRQARLLAGLVRLAAGQPVTVVALEVGYESPSAFIAMFKRALGTTPGQYFAP